MGQMEEFREIFMGMARRFTSVYHIDLKNDAYHAFSQAGPVAEKFPDRGNYGKLIAQISETLIHPRDRLLYLEMLSPVSMKRRLENHCAQEFEYRMRVADGSYHWMRNETVPAEPGAGPVENVILFTTDIHAQKLKEDRDKDILRIALENSPGDVFTYDPVKDEIEFFTMGRSKVPVVFHLKALEAGAEIGGARFSNFCEMRAAIKKLIAGGGRKQVELSGQREDGAEIWARVTLKGVRSVDGGISGVVGVAEDITPLKEIEGAFALEEQYRKTVQKDSLASYIINFTRGIYMGCEKNETAAMLVKNGQDYEKLLLQGARKMIAKPWRREFCERFSILQVFEAYQSGKKQIEMEFETQPGEQPGGGRSAWLRADLRLLMDYRKNELIGYLHFIDIDAEKRREEELVYIAEHDPLTGLYNKSVMEQKIREYLGGAKNREGILLMIDLDDFKGINDTCGHPEGDRVLREIAEILKNHFRQEDVIGRAGGDEFCVFISGGVDREKLEQRLSYICGESRKIYPAGHGGPRSTCSIGAAKTSVGRKTFEQLYREADAALYRRKAAGGDGYTIVD